MNEILISRLENIIVTGATGFIGRRLIKELLKNYPAEKILCLIKDNIRNNDELEISGRKILKDLNIKTRDIDLPSGRGLNELPLKADIVFHLGASTESGDKDHSCNDTGTKNLLNALSPVSTETKFIYTSTAAVYSGRKDIDRPIDQKTIPAASNEYGRSKLRAEEIIKKYSDKFGFSVTVIRINTVWGEGTRKNGLFDKMNKLILNNSIIPRLNWPGKTGLLNVDNAAEIITSVTLIKSIDKFAVYNTAHESLTLSEISEIMHGKLKRKYIPVMLPELFWNLSGALIQMSPALEKILPAGIYNNFWRLNLILNDSLWSKPDEIFELVPEMNIKMKRFE